MWVSVTAAGGFWLRLCRLSNHQLLATKQHCRFWKRAAASVAATRQPRRDATLLVSLAAEFPAQKKTLSGICCVTGELLSRRRPPPSRCAFDHPSRGKMSTFWSPKFLLLHFSMFVSSAQTRVQLWACEATNADLVRDKDRCSRHGWLLALNTETLTFFHLRLLHFCPLCSLQLLLPAATGLSPRRRGHHNWT